MMRSRLLFASLAVAAGVPAVAAAEDKVTYVDHVLPIFRNACLNCHNPDKKKAGLDLSAYAKVMEGSEGGQVINPGSAEDSLLFRCIFQKSDDPKMPPKGEKLADKEIAIIKNWIAGFALETASSKPAKKNSVDVAVVSLERPDGPPPMPGDLPLDPVVHTDRPNALVALAASPWAPLVAVGGQKQVILYNTGTLEPVGILPFPEGFPSVVRFSRNGKLLLTGGGLGGKSGKVVLWNVLTGERSGAVGDEVDQVLAADVSADQAHVALGGPTRILKIYATKDGALEHSIKKHTDWITAIAFSPDGKYLASADRNGGIVVWEGATGNEFNVLAGHKGMVTALAFMPGVLASGSEDGKIVLWDVKEGKEIKKWDAHGGGVASLDFTPDGRLVSCGRDKVAKVWDKDGNVTTTSEPLGDIAVRAALSGDRVVAGDWSGAIKVFGLDGKPVGELTSNPTPIADHLADVKKQLAAAEAARPEMQRSFEAATQNLRKEKDDAEAKRKADLAENERLKNEVSEKLAAAKALPDQAEKSLTDAQEQLAAAVRERGQADENRKGADEQNADAAQAFEAAEKAVADRTRQVEKLAAELERIRKEAPEQVAALQKRLDATAAEIAKLSQPPAPPKPAVDEKRIAELSKKLDGLNQEIARRREDREKKQSTPGYDAANKAVQDIKPQIAAAEKDLEAAKATLVLPKGSPAGEHLAKSKTALEESDAAIAAAQAGLERWTKAQSFMAVYRATETLKLKEELHEELLASAKNAFLPVEQAKTKIAAIEKQIADAPERLKEKEAALAAAGEAAKSAADKAAAAGTQLQEKEAALAGGDERKKQAGELQAKLDQLNQEIAKRRESRAKEKEGTPEYDRANEQVQGIKPDIAAAEKALNDAQGALDENARKAAEAEIGKARDAVRLARNESDEAQKSAGAAAAQADEARGAAERLRGELAQVKSRLPEFEKAAAAARNDAESQAASLAKELEKIRADTQRAKAEFDARWHPAPELTGSDVASGG